MRRFAPASMVVLIALVSGCGGGPSGTPKGGAVASAAALKQPAREARLPRPPRAARTRAARLPVADAAAQLIIAGFRGTDFDAPVFANRWGAIVVAAENAATPDDVAAMAGEAVAAARAGGRVAPLVMSAEDVQAAGITLAFSPVADLAVSAGPAAQTGFSDDPREAAVLVARAVRSSLGAGVVPAVGHFPGQGGASQDPIEGPASVGVSADQLVASDLLPFRAAIKVRAPAIVVSSAAFAAFDPVTPASLTPAITRDLLRRKLRFSGAAVSDDIAGVAAATGLTQEASAVAAVRAGIDLLYVPDPAATALVRRALVEAVRSGRISTGRLRDAAARVLELKRRAGL